MAFFRNKWKLIRFRCAFVRCRYDDLRHYRLDVRINSNRLASSIQCGTFEHRPMFVCVLVLSPAERRCRRQRCFHIFGYSRFVCVRFWRRTQTKNTMSSYRLVISRILWSISDWINDYESEIIRGCFCRARWNVEMELYEIVWITMEWQKVWYFNWAFGEWQTINCQTPTTVRQSWMFVRIGIDAENLCGHLFTLSIQFVR